MSELLNEKDDVRGVIDASEALRLRFGVCTGVDVGVVVCKIPRRVEGGIGSLSEEG